MTAPTTSTETLLAASLRAAAAADTLGIDTDRVRTVHADAVARLGFPSDTYVLALVGGTGVGKSSLLNALAGSPVSEASVLRPTTSDAIVWIPADNATELRPLLEWLGVTEVREHDREALAKVAILDLPDVDSIKPEHRARVEDLLPRVDAVAWVTDPEKYHDAVLHDAFLQRWLPRLDRQVMIVNKVDRLGDKDRERVRTDLERDLGITTAGQDRSWVPVLLTAAQAPDGPDLDELQRWLVDSAEAKAVVRARLTTTLGDAIDSLARAAGIDPSIDLQPLLGQDDRRTALAEATATVLRAVDLPGLERQAVAATRASARARGTGPIGLITSLAYRLSGRAAQHADPATYLVHWRERAPLAPAVEALRLAVEGSLRVAPPAVRPVLAASLAPTELQRWLEASVDRAVVRHDDLAAPTSRWWSVLGALQTLTTGAIALSVAWIVIWILTGSAVQDVDVFGLARVPTPLVALVVSLLGGYLLARILGLHAGWVGHRWARRLRSDIASGVADAVTTHGLAALDDLETARRDLWAASRDALGTAKRI
ncbi:MAG: 50S ribosome-binding GTPase [Chloroflexi bacterium]|nr:50S ribosome-binding GTPase [Chloroflexota bacterium]